MKRTFHANCTREGPEGHHKNLEALQGERRARPRHAKNGYPDMVIMSTETYEGLERAAKTGRIVSMVQEGIDAVERGECRDAAEAVASIRSRYGL